MSEELREDRTRLHLPETGIPVRALRDLGGQPSWGPVDISHLSKESLVTWLRSEPELAERVVLMLLGHR